MEVVEVADVAERLDTDRALVVVVVAAEPPEDGGGNVYPDLAAVLACEADPPAVRFPIHMQTSPEQRIATAICQGLKLLGSLILSSPGDGASFEARAHGSPGRSPLGTAKALTSHFSSVKTNMTKAPDRGLDSPLAGERDVTVV